VSADSDIRSLVADWVAAIQSRDLEGVLRQHDPGIVMFDVPPPYLGVRGLDDYRDSWGPFFDWLRSSDAVFELDELNVEAGSDVAFAYGILRCGTPADLATNPDNRLRLTLGLRKVGDQWIVVHEHHSFPMT
jgi:ketosteroid isomerase-like protein